MGIRYKSGEVDKLSKLVRNMNNKINRLIKKGYDPETLPNKSNFKSVFNGITTRKDLNKFVKTAEKFNKRGGEVKYINSNKTLKKLEAKAERKAKVLKEMGYNEALFPSIKSSREKREMNPTRKSQYKQMLNNFVKTGSEKIAFHSDRGGDIPEFFFKNEKIMRDEINKIRKMERERIEKLDLTAGGEKISSENKLFSNPNMDELRERQFKYEHKSEKDLEMYARSLKEYDVTIEKKREVYKNNLLKSLGKTFTDSQYNELKKIIDGLSAQYISDLFYSDRILNIHFSYSSRKIAELSGDDEEETRNDFYAMALESWKRAEKDYNKNYRK